MAETVCAQSNGRRSRKWCSSALCIVALTAGVQLTTARAASAHDTGAVYEKNYAWVREGHTSLRVRDDDCDGNRAYAQAYEYRSGTSVLVTVWDDDGCSGSPNWWGIRASGSGFYMYRVCENRVGCAGWHSA